MPLRLIFMGTPEFAVPTLAELIAAGHQIAAVYCQPARPAGRGMAERPSAVEAFARSQNLDIRSPASLKGEAEQAAFREVAADVGIVVAYGLLLPKAILEAPRDGCLNLHPSKLPRWRGAAPIQRTLMAGDTETAVMAMRMDEGLDTGPVCLGEHVPVPAEATAQEMQDLLARRGADLMVRALAALDRGSLDCRPQPAEGVTYARKIDKAEARIDWRRTAAELHNHVRGLSPFPGAWFEATIDGKLERIKVLRSELRPGAGTPGAILDDKLTIACGSGGLGLVTVQRAGKKPMVVEEFLRGVRTIVL